MEEVLANLVEGPGAITGMNETARDTWNNIEGDAKPAPPQLATGRYDELMTRAAQVYADRFPQVAPLLKRRDELADPGSIAIV